MLAPWKENYDQPRQCIKKQRHHFVDKSLHSQSYDFSSSHVRMWELDHKESWAPKNWCLQTVLLEKTLESPLDSKIKAINPKGNQPWIFIERSELKMKFQYFGHLMWAADSLENTLLLGRLRTTEDEMVGWHHRLNGHESEQTLGPSEGQGSLAFCSSWGCKESDMT